MSHFSTAAITVPDGKTIEELLAPYDEELQVEPYKSFLSKKDTGSMAMSVLPTLKGVFEKMIAEADNYKGEARYEFIDKQESEVADALSPLDLLCLAGQVSQYHGGVGGGLEDDRLYYLTTYNPMSKWDWYSVGGRWSGRFDWKDTAALDEVAESLIEDTPFALIVPSGEWHESGSMGWFGSVSDEKPKDEWQGRVREAITPWLNKDATVTILDLHI